MTVVENIYPAKNSTSTGLIWLIVLVAASVPIFWSAFQSLGSAWMTPEYSHGPLIPLISLYLFLRERRAAPTARPEARRNATPGIALLLFALGFAVFGNMVRIPDLVTYALIFWVGALVLIGLGWEQGKRHWAPVLHLVFMLPLPLFVYWKLTVLLQGISSEIGVWLIELARIPVFLDGNVIDLGVYQLQVAEACSGLRYLFPILSFSYLFAILYRGPIWHKATLLLLAAPLSVLMNSFRIGMIGVLVNSHGIGAAEGFLHLFEGWVIFGACIGVLFAVAVALQRFSPNPLPLSETIDLDFEGFADEAKKITSLAASTGLYAAAALALIIGTAFLVLPRPEHVTVERDSFALFPHQIENWEAEMVPLQPATEDVLAADDYINALYVSPTEAAPVSFFSAWYGQQTEGSGIHSPEVCLPVGGWEVSSIKPAEVSFPDTTYGTFDVNRAVIQKGFNKQLVYYWFEQRGKRMTNDYMAKIDVVYDSLTRGRSDGALVRVVTGIARGESEADADARLRRFMADVLPKLPRYIPE